MSFDTDMVYTSATDIARGIRRGEYSPVEVVDAFLDRIDERDDEINAYVTVAEESARAAAREAEEALARGEELGPLHGVPVAIKDLTETAGIRTTYASHAFEEFVPEEDAVVVQRLKEAGAIVLGKTNTPEFGRKPMTTNLLFGATGSPFDPSKTAGGSSGGSAAALAGGMAPIAQGSDAAGSLRVPASACGVIGFMPDFGRVPLGASRDDAFVNTHPYTYAGPMARTVEDTALMLDVMAGPHPTDPFSLPSREGRYLEEVRGSIADLEVAYSPDLGICEVSDEVRDVVDDAVGAFGTMGADLERADPGFEQDWETLHDAIEVLLQERYLGMYDNFKEKHDLDLLEMREDVTDEVVSRIEKALALDMVDLRRAERVRTDAYDAVQGLLGEYDLLVTPTLGMTPFEKDTQPSEINGVPIDPLHGWILTWPINLTGNPTMSIPAGFSDDGLPVGLQISGPRFGDDLVLRAGAAFERARPWQDAYESLL